MSFASFLLSIILILMQRQSLNILYKGVFLSAFLFANCYLGYSQSTTKSSTSKIIPKKIAENKATAASPIVVTGTFDVYSSNCVSKTGSTAEVKATIQNQGCLEVKAEEYIDITDSFDAQPGSTFDAQIGTVPNPEPPIVTPYPCEDFTNHGKAGPHLYANTRQNELVGHVFAINQPEYNAYGVWKKMSRVTSEYGSNRSLWAYREPFQYSTNVHLRTREGCTDYPDVRNTQTQAYLGEDANLPNVLPIQNYFNINSPFACSSNIDNKGNGNQNCYSILLKGYFNTLQYRFNGGSWKSEISLVNQDSNGRLFQGTVIPFFNTSKDFVLDLTLDGGNTIDRYNVCRNTAGGHFAVTNVFTRVQDGTVIVNIQQGDHFTPLSLGDYDSYMGFGNCFNIGYRADGKYTFPLRSKETGFVLDDNIVIQAKSSRNKFIK